MQTQDTLNATPEEMEILEEVFEEYGDQNSLMICLQQVQARFRYIPEFSINFLSERMNIAESHIYGVLSFYAQFSMVPVGENIVKICKGTACHVGGAKALGKALTSYLHVDEDNKTTEDMLFTVENVACLGCCALAPAMMVNDKVYGKLDVDEIKRIIDTYRNASDSGE